jgi:hypothetical protein
MPSILTRILRRAGRLLEPLLAPDAEEQRRRADRLATLAKEQATAMRALGEQVAAARSEVQRVRELRASDVEETRGSVADLKTGMRRQGAALARLARTTGIHAQLEWTEQRVLDRLSRIARSGRPVIVGPWTGEIGFELLYWIPFVRWAAEKFGIPAERVTVVSRGGTQSWYAGLADHYVDAFSLVTPSQFRGATEAVKKQRAMRLFDRQLLRRVSASFGARPALVHPALMYALFMPFWKRQAAVTRVTDHARFERIRPDAAPTGLPALPADYVAVRFYFSACFPETEANRAFVAGVVASLAERTHVVMLNPGFRADDHTDYSPAAEHRIHQVDMSDRAHENLAWQSAIIAGARAFIGTYGGFAYLAPFCGVNALSFYTDRNYFSYHLELAQHAFSEVGCGTLNVLDVSNTDVLRAALAGVALPARR